MVKRFSRGTNAGTTAERSARSEHLGTHYPEHQMPVSVAEDPSTVGRQGAPFILNYGYCAVPLPLVTKVRTRIPPYMGIVAANGIVHIAVKQPLAYVCVLERPFIMIEQPSKHGTERNMGARFWICALTVLLITWAIRTGCGWAANIYLRNVLREHWATIAACLERTVPTADRVERTAFWKINNKSPSRNRFLLPSGGIARSQRLSVSVSAVPTPSRARNLWNDNCIFFLGAGTQAVSSFHCGRAQRLFALRILRTRH